MPKKVVEKFRQKFAPPRFWRSGSASDPEKLFQAEMIACNIWCLR